MKAPDILQTAIDQIQDRAKLRDTPQGERSMARTVAIFKSWTDIELTERHGWIFMQCLKAARAQNGSCVDDHVDLAAYAALEAECREFAN